jgi:hypothetical protein
VPGIPAKSQNRQDGQGHEFGIFHLSIRIITMMESFQLVATQTKDRYNLNVLG